MRLFLKNARRVFIFVFVALLLPVLAYAVFDTYDVYTQMVIEQQQQHLLTISRAVSQSLALYISEQLRDVEILTKTPGFLAAFGRYYDIGETQSLKEYILSYMLPQHQGLSRMYLLDSTGNVVFKYNQYPFIENFDEDVLRLDTLAKPYQSGIGTVFQISENHYGMTLINSIYGGNGYVGTVVGIVDLDILYEQFIGSLNVRDNGYIMVKDNEGTVIMHPRQEMISFNYFEDIPDIHTADQYANLNSMLQRQYDYEEGAAIFRNTTNGILPDSDEIAAFSRMNLEGTSWFVSAVMPYSGAIQLVNENMGKFGILVAAILALIVFSVSVIYSLQKQRQKLELETRYLKDINRTLEELHQSREQVRHYQKLQTIGALAGGIAHEFNNLLTPIMGYSEMIKEQLDPESEYFEDIDEIFKAGQRAKEIVEQILPFSRHETDSSSYSSVSFDVIVRDALKMVRMIVPSSIRLETQLSPTGANVYGSATQLNQVLLNLCSNAYQSMEETGGTLTVSTRSIDAEALPEKFGSAQGDFVELVVMDTGCGMSEEILEHIFDPFFTTKEVGEGTGLGLSVVQNILISHGGFIDVQSKIGKGSKFVVYLPITEIPAATKKEVKGQLQEKIGCAPILLVDDEARVTHHLAKCLSRKGYVVDAYTNPEEALDQFRKTPDRWSLLIVDYTMPKLKGTVFAQEIKRVRPQLPVLLITGLVEKDALRMQEEMVINVIMAKPLSMKELFRVVAKLLDKG